MNPYSRYFLQECLMTFLAVFGIIDLVANQAHDINRYHWIAWIIMLTWTVVTGIAYQTIKHYR